MTEEQELALARVAMYVLMNMPDYRQKEEKHWALARLGSAFPKLVDEIVQRADEAEQAEKDAQ